MRRTHVAVALVVLLGVGCGMVPRRGPELSDDQLYAADAHGWTDADARTALWFTRNFPDDFAAVGFTMYKIPSYNQHDERFGRLSGHKWAGDAGYRRGMIFNNSIDDVFGLIDDPQLRVKMLSLESRERNRMRERERRRHAGTWPYDPSSAPEPNRAPSRMDDPEVEQQLLDTYR